MKSGIPKITLCIFCIIILGFSCKNDSKFDDIPDLTWKDYKIIDSANNRRYVILITDFTDGDGDIGRDEPKYNCNVDYEAFINDQDIYIDYFELVEGVYIQVQPKDSCQPFHSTLPDLEPEGQNKTLEGEIRLTFNYIGLPENPDVDSIKFEMVLQDRAGHKSPVASSPAIALPD